MLKETRAAGLPEAELLHGGCLPKDHKATRLEDLYSIKIFLKNLLEASIAMLVAGYAQLQTEAGRSVDLLQIAPGAGLL